LGDVWYVARVVEEHRFDILVPLYAVSWHSDGVSRVRPAHTATPRDVLLCERTKEAR
jgi:hypothetical protein